MSPRECAGHDQCHRFYTHTPRLIHVDLGCCCIPLENFICPMRVNRWDLSDVLKLLLTSPSWCAHDLVDTFMPWIMLHSVGRVCLIDVHMPHPCIQALVDVPAIYRRHCMLFAVIACNMWPCHVRCVLSLADGACRWTKSDDRCVQAIEDANRPHPTFSHKCMQATKADGRKRLTSIDRYVHDINDIVNPCLTSIDWYV